MADYITAAALKATLGITNTAHDDDIQAAVTAASRAADNFCQRGANGFTVDGSATSRYYSPVRHGHLDVDDIADTTGLVLKTTDDGTDPGSSGTANTWTLNTDYVLEPLNAAAGVNPWPYTRLRVIPTGSYLFNTYFPRSANLTALFGWPAVPQPVVDGVTLLAERIYKMKVEAPMGVLAFDQVAIRQARADSNLQILWGPYRRHSAAVA